MFVIRFHTVSVLPPCGAPIGSGPTVSVPPALVPLAVLDTNCIEPMVWVTCSLAKGTQNIISLSMSYDTNLFRYPNMDFLTLCSIAHELSRRVCISYDIACQWSINWLIRLNRDTTPEDLRGALSKDITFLVPKFHLKAHTPKCHAPYSYNFTKGVGHTDGEGVERNWSTLNGIARSLSQMTPGGRWDSMDNHCNFANWRKTVDLRACINILAFNWS